MLIVLYREHYFCPSEVVDRRMSLVARAWQRRPRIPAAVWPLLQLNFALHNHVVVARWETRVSARRVSTGSWTWQQSTSWCRTATRHLDNNTTIQPRLPPTPLLPGVPCPSTLSQTNSRFHLPGERNRPPMSCPSWFYEGAKRWVTGVYNLIFLRWGYLILSLYHLYTPAGTSCCRLAESTEFSSSDQALNQRSSAGWWSGWSIVVVSGRHVVAGNLLWQSVRGEWNEDSDDLQSLSSRRPRLRQWMWHLFTLVALLGYLASIPPSRPRLSSPVNLWWAGNMKVKSWQW